MGKHTKLSEEQLDRFAEVHAATKSPIQAMLAAQPEMVVDKNYATVKGVRLAKSPDVRARIDKKLQKMAPKAMKRIDKLIASDNEHIASANAWKVVEHNIGTPIKRNLNVGVKASIEDVLFD